MNEREMNYRMTKFDYIYLGHTFHIILIFRTYHICARLRKLHTTALLVRRMRNYARPH